jgi:ribokinase
MSARIPTVAVVGSLNLDLVVRTARRPRPGETLVGESFATYIGGKGLNQAIAAARLGARVRMVGRVGADDFGQRLLDALAREGIDAAHVCRDDTAGTGIAAITVDAAGDNSIIIVPGANGRVAPADVDAAADLIAGADVLLLQLEVPLPAVQRAAVIAAEAGVPVVLNPAPAAPLPDDLLRLVRVLTPNESESERLTGLAGAADAAMARALLARGPRAVVMTLGGRGALLADGPRLERIPGYPVQVVDTTAAGDAFCAALAVRLAEGADLAAAVRFANAAGALATTAAGAEPSLPRRAAVEALLGA